AIEDLPTDFTSALSIPQHQQVLDAFSRLDLISQGSQWPKLFQLKCLISLWKTLAMILPLLLSPNKIAITVTPLKLLQYSFMIIITLLKH
ncbi:hypothetical protein BDR04DRAFT_1085784, partial [Suillus decipiens]